LLKSKEGLFIDLKGYGEFLENYYYEYSCHGKIIIHSSYRHGKGTFTFSIQLTFYIITMIIPTIRHFLDFRRKEREKNQTNISPNTLRKRVITTERFLYISNENINNTYTMNKGKQKVKNKNSSKPNSRSDELEIKFKKEISRHSI